MKNLSVVGIGSTVFGQHKCTSITGLAKKAASDAILDAGIDKGRIGALYVGNFVSGPLSGQEVLGGILTNALGLGAIPATKVEGACASGGIAFRHACLSVAAGLTDYAIAIGVEKMTHRNTNVVTEALNSALDRDIDGEAGHTFPGLYGLAWRLHAKHYGTSRAQVSAVVRKNKRAGLKNPLAQMGKMLSEDDIINSRVISDPLRLYDCCPVTDGASAVIVTTAENAKYSKTPISVLSTVQTSGNPHVPKSEGPMSFQATQVACNEAIQIAGITRQDVSLIELHDCFSIAEIIDLEDLGFINPGHAASWAEEGRTDINGDLPTNPSGGLISKGHPVGATGVGQIFELCKQLRGTHPNQVRGAKIGLAHNLGGCGVTCSVSILANPNA